MRTKTLILIFLSLTMSVSSWGYSFVYNGIYYNILSGNTSVSVTYRNTNYNSYSGSVTIPSSVSYSGRTYSVTSIGNYAFYKCTGLTSVTIPNSVTSIGDQAFEDCTGLTSVTLPNSVTSIGSYAFFYCTGLTSVTLPNSVTSIGNFAFYRCTGLTSVTLPNSVTSIGDYAFYNTGITVPLYNNTIFAYMPTSYSGSYTIPSGITTIARYAFSSCTGLTSVTIPNSVTSIGYYAFSNCTGLTSVTIPNSVTSIVGSAFRGCTGITSPLYNNTIFAYMPTSYSGSYTIPSGITTIAGCAFENCTGLTSVTIPNSVTSIDYDAFYKCTGLASVTIPNSVTSIGDNAFRGCTGITSPLYNNTIFAYMPTSYSGSYTIPSGITTIAGYAFYNCTGLTSVTLPNGVTSIGWSAFENCTGLTSVYFKRVNPPTIGPGCFENANPTYYVPCGTTSAYKTKLGASSTIVESFEYTVTVLPSDTLLGTVAITQQPSCQQPAVIQASAIPHYHFKQWSDGDTSNPRSVNVTSDTSLTAFFEIDRHTVSSNSSLVEGTGEYDYGTTVTLTAHSEEHIHFIEWEDGVTDSTRSFVLQGDVTMNAVYELDSFLIQTTCLHGTVSGGGKYGYSDIVTLTVTPDEGYRFVKWSDDNEYNPRVFVVREDLTVEAICEEAPVIDDVENVQTDTPAFYVIGTTVFNPSNEQLRVYSTEGKLIKSADTDIDLFGYPAGIYIVTDSRGNSVKMAIR